MPEEPSSFNLPAFVLLVFFAALTWRLPRRLAPLPLLATVCLMPLGQEIVVAGLHFFFFRVLLLVGLARILVKRELQSVVFQRLDWLLVWWGLVTVVFGVLADPSFDLLRNRGGEVFNAFACYFFLRSVVLDSDDVLNGIRTLAWLSLPIAAAMLVEKATGSNLFHFFGGVGELSEVRDGTVRAQGAFRHPILAGTFGATQIPLFIALWICRKEHKKLAMAAVTAGLVIVFAASSSGALMAFAASCLGLPFWYWRRQLPLMRRMAILGFVVLSLFMTAPVWSLFDRLSSITGGTGWYRSYLIGQAVEHFGEWWAFGTTYTAHWVPWGDLPLPNQPNMADITNHYIMEGVKGGIVKLCLFLALIACAFSGIGRTLKNLALSDRKVFLAWAAGVSLFGHCLSFLSVHYFDQTILVWYWLLASIIAIPVPYCRVLAAKTAAASFSSRESDDIRSDPDAVSDEPCQGIPSSSGSPV